uniref:TIGR02452 family protein n=1 Tax=Prevotella sp. TaxID=59823 RepID=UPI0040268752
MKNGDREAYYQIKGLRTKVYRNTIDLVTQGHYTTEDGKRVELGDGAEMMNATVYYDHEIETDAPTADETCIEVVNDDCLAVAMRLKADGYTPAVLNMANRHHPGGGVDNGAAALEETLIRRTALYRSLYRFSPLAKVKGLPP